MKRKHLEKRLKGMGWWFLRHGGRHDVFTDGDREEPIPRHTEINEKLARSILRKVRRLSENRLLLRSAANSDGGVGKSQNVLNVGYCYAYGGFGLVALPSKFSLDLATKPFSDSLPGKGENYEIFGENI